MNLKLTATIAGLACAFLTAPAVARAGSYDVYGCHLPTGATTGTSGWVAGGTAHAPDHNTCDSGGNFGVRLITGSIPDDAQGRWTFNAPEGTTINNYALHRLSHSVTGRAGTTPWVKGAALTTDFGSLSSEYVQEMCFAWGNCASLGQFADPLGPSSVISGSQLSAQRLIAAVHCFGPCPATASTGYYDIYAARVGLSDPSAPVLLREPSGSLFSNRDVAGTQSVSFTAADRGGGLYRVGVVVDGVTYGSRAVDPKALTCARPVTTPVPCPLSASLSYNVNTAALPDGLHRLQLAVSDIAGNTTLSDPVTVGIRNHARPNGVNASRDVRLSARFKGHGHYRVARYGGRPRIVGSLVRSDGRAISGARLLVLGRAKRSGSAYRTLGMPVTDGQGRFHLKLPKGPSRHIRVSYRAYDLDATDAAERHLELDVHAGVRLSIHPRSVTNGHRIVFRGRLLGGPGRKGALITMQETTPRPLTFMTLHADRHGRFHGTYRFRYTYRPSRFRFRALVQHQGGYPYIRGRSRAVTVRVRP